MRAWAEMAVVKKPPLQDRKGLQALTVLIGSIMKPHGTYLMVTTGDILFVRTKLVTYDSRQEIESVISRVQV